MLLVRKQVLTTGHAESSEVQGRSGKILRPAAQTGLQKCQEKGLGKEQSNLNQLKKLNLEPQPDFTNGNNIPINQSYLRDTFRQFLHFCISVIHHFPLI